jgi:hypothetical protein
MAHWPDAWKKSSHHQEKQDAEKWQCGYERKGDAGDDIVDNVSAGESNTSPLEIQGSCDHRIQNRSS